MEFYFSGVGGRTEFNLLTQQAQAQRLMLDPWNWPLLAASNWEGHVALDSGAYAASRRGYRWEVADFAAFLDQQLPQLSPQIRCDFVVSLDVIGDNERTRQQFDQLRAGGYPMLPVWQWPAADRWEADQEHLRYYLASAERVCLGGLVPRLRAHDESTLRSLLGLAREYPQRFHVLDLCWLKALNHLQPYLRSGDSSEWLRAAAQKGLVILLNRSAKGTRFLSAPPLGCLDPGVVAVNGWRAKGDSRPARREAKEARCRSSVRNIELFLADGEGA